jgi:hypothetical protein
MAGSNGNKVKNWAIRRHTSKPVNDKDNDGVSTTEWKRSVRVLVKLA